MMTQLVDSIVEVIQDKKGENIVVLDLRSIEGAMCDYFVVCNAASTVQVSAIANAIDKDVREKTGQKVWRTDGLQNSLWVAIDYGDVMVHVFQNEMRDYYKLEELWGDAKITEFN